MRGPDWVRRSGACAGLSRREAEVTRALVETINTVGDGDPPVLEGLIAPLQALLDSERVASFGVDQGPDGASVSFACGSPGLARTGPDPLDGLVRDRPRDFAAFDALHPAPAQRNVVLLARDLGDEETLAALPAVQQLFPAYGLCGLDFLRVLVCDGPVLLAWVGAFRRAPFTDRERCLLAAIVPQLRIRLAVERQLRQAMVSQAALETALEAGGAPAFVLRRPGIVVHANSAGAALLECERRATREALRRVAAGCADASYLAFSFSSAGLPDHWLAIRRPVPEVPARRAAAAALTWGLTPRQRDVLALLATGKCNKEIATELGCAERTVELHVSACLDKARCEQRAGLVARFWTEL